MVEPQLIILREGMFRPVGFIKPQNDGNYQGKELRLPMVLGLKTGMHPRELHLALSCYLGPVQNKSNRPFHTDPSAIEQDLFQTLDYANNVALRLARKQEMPYYGLDFVITGEDFRGMKSDRIEQNGHLLLSEVEPVTTQFTLHPTVQLYVPR